MTFEFRRIEAADGLPKAVRAYHALRAAIIAMQLKPGAMLVERDICAQLGISRTPIREAVLRLAQEGLVNVVPSGGTFVSPICVRDVIEGRIVREALEMRMARLAARHYRPDHQRDFDLLMFRQGEASERADADEALEVDNEFHRQICVVAGFPNVWQTIQAATGQLDRLRRQAFVSEGRFEAMTGEQAALRKAIAAHDEAGAVRLMQAHLEGIGSMLHRVMASDPAIVLDAQEKALLEMPLATGV